MTVSVQDKVAVVTGGGQGLGNAICWRLAREGCDVVVADLNEETATKTAADLNAFRPRASRIGAPSRCVWT